LGSAAVLKINGGTFALLRLTIRAARFDRVASTFSRETEGLTVDLKHWVLRKEHGRET